MCHEKLMWFRRVLLCVISVIVLGALNGEAQAAARVLAVKSFQKAGEELLEIQFSEPVEKQKLFSLDAPQRVVLDVSKVESAAVALPSDYDGRVMQSVRFGQNSPATSRFVITLNEAVKAVNAHEFDAQGDTPFRIVVALSIGDAALQQINRSVNDAADVKEQEVAQVDEKKEEESSSFFSFFTRRSNPKDDAVATEGARDAYPVSGRLPRGYRPSVGGDAGAFASKETVTYQRDDAPVEAAKIAPQEEVTNAPEPEQEEVVTAPKNKGLPLVVIDAGHGGKDPGAIGARGEKEKTITLAFAKRLANVLNNSGRYRAKLTRDGDSFIMLGERVEIARRAGASLFISLHADSAPGSQAEGLSVYTVSETASDKASEKLAASENNADKIGGLNLGVQEKVVADILSDLAYRETKNKSTEFAEAIARAMRKSNVRMLPDPHRFAGFRVLKAPDVPSVLIELGFISTPSEAANLQSSAHRDRITKAIVAGIDDYL